MCQVSLKYMKLNGSDNDLKIASFFKTPFAWKTESTLKSVPDFLLIFQQLRIKSAPSE